MFEGRGSRCSGSVASSSPEAATTAGGPGPPTKEKRSVGPAPSLRCRSGLTHPGRRSPFGGLVAPNSSFEYFVPQYSFRGRGRPVFSCFLAGLGWKVGSGGERERSPGSFRTGHLPLFSVPAWPENAGARVPRGEAAANARRGARSSQASNRGPRARHGGGGGDLDGGAAGGVSSVSRYRTASAPQLGRGVGTVLWRGARQWAEAV